MVLAELEERPVFPLVGRLECRLGRPLTRAERSALHRAAHALRRKGRCHLVLLWDENDFNSRLVTCAARPGLEIDGRPIEAISVERVPGGTRSTFKGSLRDIARELNVSVATVRRDLASHERRHGQARPGEA
jgi:hypothetical protein